MNLTRDFPVRSRRDAAYSIFALMIVCAAFVTTAIGERLAVQVAGGTTVMSLADRGLRTDQGMRTARERLRETKRRPCQKAVNCSGPSFQADCVRCIDDASAAAGRLQGPSLATDAESGA